MSNESADLALRNSIMMLETKIQDVTNAIERTEEYSKYEGIVGEELQCRIDSLNRAYNFYEKKDLEYFRRFLQAQQILENSKDDDGFLGKFTNVFPQKVPDDEALSDSTPEEAKAVAEENDEGIEESLLAQELRSIEERIGKNEEYIKNKMENVLSSMKFVPKFPDFPGLPLND